MKYFFEAGVGSIPAFSMAETAVKASGTGARRLDKILADYHDKQQKNQ